MTTLTRQQEIDIIASVLSKHPEVSEPSVVAEHVIDALSMSQPKYQCRHRWEAPGAWGVIVGVSRCTVCDKVSEAADLGLSS